MHTGSFNGRVLNEMRTLSSGERFPDRHSIIFKKHQKLRYHSLAAFHQTRGNTVEITTVTRDGATILSIAGRIDTATAPALEQAINKEIEGGNRKVLLNFSAVTYISSGGLRVLLATAKKLKNPGDKYALCCLAAEVHKILKLAGFTSIFSIYPSEGEALAGW